MGVIQSGINQAIQTAAIIGQLQEVPQKKAERKMTAAELENIEKEKNAYKKYFKDIDIPYYLLPSTSSANASCDLNTLILNFKAILANYL